MNTKEIVEKVLSNPEHYDEDFIKLAEHIREMEDALLYLECLQDAGVDNWSGVDFAQEIYKENGGKHV